MTLAYSSITALLVAALSVMAESAILRCAVKDRPKLGDKFKRQGYILIGVGILFLAIGALSHFFPQKYIDPELYFSLAIALGVPGCLIAIQGITLKSKQHREIGETLRWSALVMAIIAVGLFIAEVVRIILSLLSP
jgi:hypothetical protein